MRIIVIGGFSSTGGERIASLVEAIRREAFPGEVLAPNYFEIYGKIGKYFRRKTIHKYAKDLLRLNLVDLNENEPIVLIGYSMGGVVLRYLVEKMQFPTQFPTKTIVLVGVPNRGIKLSPLERVLLKIIKVPCIRDIEENSEFLKELSIPDSENYYFIGSDKDEKVDIESAIPIPIRKEGKFYVLHCNHSGLIPKGGKVENSAIPIIIDILRKEIQT